MGSQGRACFPGWGEDVESRKLGNLAGGAFPRQTSRSESLPSCDVCTCELWEAEFNPAQPTAGAGPWDTKLGRGTPSSMLRTGPEPGGKGRVQPAQRWLCLAFTGCPQLPLWEAREPGGGHVSGQPGGRSCKSWALW